MLSIHHWLVFLLTITLLQNFTVIVMFTHVKRVVSLAQADASNVGNKCYIIVVCACVIMWYNYTV